MPVCKNCGARISKFDSDMCPVCGCKKPLEGVSSETVEITSEISLGSPEFKNYHFTNRKIVCVLFALLGVLGTGFFYAKYKKAGLYWLLINLVIIGGFGSLLAFLVNLGPLWGFLIPTIAMYVVNIGIGIYFLTKPNLKDGQGEFMH